MRTTLDTGARLRRLRRRLTVMFTLTTAICLAVLGFFAAQIDGQSRQRSLDGDLNRRATGLSRVSWYDQAAGAHLQLLDVDPLAAGQDTVVVLRADGGPYRPVYTGRSGGYLPGPADQQRIARQVTDARDLVMSDGHTQDGHPVRLASAPVWSLTGVAAVLVVSGDPDVGRADHEILVRWLAGTCIGLALLAGAAGHLLSRRSISPALRILERQERFLSDAAHELRTPLSTLRLVAEEAARDPSTAPQALRQAVRLSDQMGRLVSGLLARTRVQGGTQDVELIKLRLDQLVEQVLDELPHSGFTMHLRTVPSVVHGDPDLLALAVRNLVTNALLHGARGGRPVIEVSVRRGRVAVRDHGPGISPSVRGRVFTRGVSRPDGGGTGLGLAIVTWVADVHGGGVRIGDAVGGGALAEFVVGEQFQADPPEPARRPADPVGIVGSADPVGIVGSDDPVGIVGSADPVGPAGIGGAGIRTGRRWAPAVAADAAVPRTGLPRRTGSPRHAGSHRAGRRPGAALHRPGVPAAAAPDPPAGR